MPVSPAPKLNGCLPENAQLSKSISRTTSVREMRQLQERVLSKAIEDTTDKTQLCMLVRAYGELRERIRIEKGWIKPGSRNISVREGDKPVKRTRRTRTHVSEIDSAARSLGLLPAIDVPSQKTEDSPPAKE